MQGKIDTMVIIVNWNGQHLLGDCLQSLQEQTNQNFKIILVDNGSTDSSVSYTRENFSKVKIIELTENTGFAKGNNIGISRALENKKIKNIILLNNDTKVKKDFIENLIQYQEEHRGSTSVLKIGALAPKMLLQNKLRSKTAQSTQSIDAVGARIGLDGRGYNIGHGEIDEGQYDKSQEVFGFCGGAVLLRREMLEDIRLVKSKICFAKVGPLQSCEGSTFTKEDIKYHQYFDNNFFAYYEDADLNLRMRSRGWRTVTVPKAVVYHLHSATADTIKSKTFKAYYLNRNRFLMMLKNFPRNSLWKGILQIPKSYFKSKDDEGEQKSTKNKNINKQNKATEIPKSKIKMIGVMTRMVYSLLFNTPRIIQQRRLIQSRTLISEDDFKKGLV